MMDHRVLTVREPYASLLAYGVKKLETRPQPTAYRGLVFILAGKFQSEPLRNMGEEHRRRLFVAGCGHASPAVWNDPIPGRHDWFARLPRAAIIGVAYLAACHAVLDLVEDEKLHPYEASLGNYPDDGFAYQMEDAIAFKAPVPCRGLLGLTMLKDDVLAAAMAEMYRADPNTAADLVARAEAERVKSLHPRRALHAIEADVVLSD